MFTRRDFIKTGAALVSLGAGVPRIFRQGLALANYDASDQPERTLVVVQLAGGNDGLNTIVPYNDGNYRSLRPTLGIAPDKVIQLNDTLGLHPT
ncbi:MAG TPA: twin-arginine translocation signal domain-containing protein, partial [Dehalococcoidia bacterium]